MNTAAAKPLNNISQPILNGWLGKERSTCVSLALALLPWVGISLLTSGVLGAACLMAFSVLALSAGYALITAVIGDRGKGCGLVLAPATGILALSAVTAFWLLLDLPLVWVSVAWSLLAVI